MERLVLVDGHAILHRAYHAYPPLTTSKGELVGAVYGFTSILLTVLKKLHPEYVAVSFDKKAPTFRHKKFKAYKAHRPKMDEDLVQQQKRVHQVVKALNIPIFEKNGYEADDVIGTLVRQASKSIKEILIITGDQDALQLVDNNVKVYMPARGKQPEKIYDRKAVLTKYHLEPRQIVDLKALAGDPSDGIPGVEGIGPKTAQDLLVKYGKVEKLYKRLEDLPEKVARKLKSDKKSAFLSKELAEIDTKVPIKLDLSCCQLTDYDRAKVLQLFRRLEFKTLIKKLPNDQWLEMAEETMGSKKKKAKKDKGQQMGLF